MLDKETAKAEIAKLIEKYNREKGKRYNEEATKNDFILPLFRILGWDTEDSNEVSKEENISGKRVDYGFRIDGIPKFFLEAKGMDEDLEGSRTVKGREVTYTEQAINYAYYKGCNWAILTNFKGIIVYDAWAKASSQSSFRFAIWVDNLLNDFDNNLYLLSRDAFEQSLLDKRYSTKSRKRPITEQLLLDFTSFRAMLSKDVYALNKSKNLTEEELDEAIQRLFDRLIFIRNCEDRELEPYELLSVLRQWNENKRGTLVNKLRELFTHFDEIYNSKIFSKHLCDQVDISDNVLSHILNGMYSTEDGSIQYDFSLIDADVLGNIYEQYLGHILKKTEKRTKLTESKAKRKEEGIYYTPNYIVDYIVRNTVGELIKSKKVDVSKIKVLDPACGSGSFLIKTFDVLNEYYSKKESYNQNKLDLSGTGTTYSTKLSILKDNIFGVDLDKQAVDIAQLNLLLKVAEKKRRLPILQQNIKNGNSLIDDTTIAGDKAFKWNEEFKEIMDNGGFDVVVGNPPYFLLQPQNTNAETISYTKTKFRVAQYKIDTYHLFFEKGIQLLKDGGYFSYITPNTYMMNIYTTNLRKYILENCRIIKIVIIPKEVFVDASVDTSIIILRKDSNAEARQNNKISVFRITDFEKEIKQIGTVKQGEIYQSPNYIFNIGATGEINKLIGKIRDKGIVLGDICRVSFGLQTKDKKTWVKETPLNEQWKPCIDGGDIIRYSLKKPTQYFLHDIKIKAGGCWDETTFDVPEKILIRQIGVFPIATLDRNRYYCLNTLYKITDLDERFSYRYILGIINSKLVKLFWKVSFSDSKLLFPKIKKAYLDQIPIVIAIKEKQEEVSKLVEKIMELTSSLAKTGNKITDESNRLKDGIIKTDKEIDELVYKLYGITEEEKKIIEESL
ncbi:MAG: N-6 DNA methylase [Candidatus Parvarchaeum sp.]